MRYPLPGIALLALGGPGLTAQAPPDLEFRSTMDSMIVLAEAEGRSHPTPAAAALQRLARYDFELGSAERACARTDGQRKAFQPVRSGEFIVGTSFDRLATGAPVKMWWVPAESSGDMTLLVRGRKLDDESEVLRWTSDRVGFPVGPDPPRKIEEIDDWFFPSDFLLPSAGDWIVVATSGPNWGCFVVTLPPPGG